MDLNWGSFGRGAPIVIPVKTGIQCWNDKTAEVYILARKRNGTLYIGVTNDLQKRTWEQKQDLVDGFTKRYAVHSLVYHELHENLLLAIQREKQIKKWNRAWKLELIEKHNSDWSDLWPAIV